MKVKVEVSLGELIDKISILEIKTEKIQDPTKVKLAEAERRSLQNQLDTLKLEGAETYLKRLKEVNLKLWDIEDGIRRLETRKDFGAQFIELARAVYRTNDQRFVIKDEINQHFGSRLREVKSYARKESRP